MNKNSGEIIKTDLVIAGLIFILTLLLLSVSSCKHEPILPEGITISQNGNNNNNNNNPINTCSPDSVYFQNTILPLIVSNCATSGCHDAASHQDGIVLDSYQNIMVYGDIRAGRPGSSELYEVITDNDPDKRMPPLPLQALSQTQINQIAQWINQGALNNNCTENNCDSSISRYSVEVSQIISAKCSGCHNSTVMSGQINLSNYQGVNSAALNGSLLGSITHQTGWTPMPQGSPKLSDCEIALIRTWVQNGAINN
ncbi:MAG: hypothetical protein DWQ44_11690 [Bacteroidetes bacterium]|nr:MAG: hypothetical protein DWQ33_10655 [Bacteroidota bacterium]REK05283.1 MAG: hypothetical protein DWQ39_08820 [Bacteroidota bacterium]REK32688.1 MAG: hypothetical protein DWQ44_11690 [Bacteroidota bacterium]REK48865.1 MAG: hypothetical protein DWQ48_08270 [Bacteroidota bacterium]